MVTKKVSELTSIDAVTSADQTLITDVSANLSKKATAAQLQTFILGAESGRIVVPAGTTAIPPVKLTTQASPLTTPQQGALELIGNSLQFTQLAKRCGVVQCSNVLVATVSATNTTTETVAMITGEHGANYLEIGKMEEIYLFGTVQQTVSGGGQLQIRTKYAGVTILTVTTATGNITAGTPIEIHIIATCRTTGATGTMQINSHVYIEGISNPPDAQALVTIDTTIAQATTVTAQWTIADASNSLAIHQGRVLTVEPSR